MVEIRDVTNEKKREMERAILEGKLAEECFPGQAKLVTGVGVPHISVERGGKPLAFKWIGIVKMDVYDKNILSQAEQFGRRYEEQFSVRNFIIETDYSKDR